MFQNNYLIFCVIPDIIQLKIAKGLALNDILIDVHTYIHRSKYNQYELFYLWQFDAIPVFAEYYSEQ